MTIRTNDISLNKLILQIRFHHFMAENCFECKNKIEEHSIEQSKQCLSKLSDSLVTVSDVQTKLREITEEEALDQFVNTKTGEPSRMGSK